MDTLENCRLRVNGGARSSQNKVCLQTVETLEPRESGLGEEEVGQGPLGRENGICKCGRPGSQPSSWGEPRPRDRGVSWLSLSDPVILNPIWVPRAGAAYGAGREGSPVAVMPDPRVAAVLGSEVRLAIVVDLGGEAQEPPVARGGVGVGGRGREAVLLHGALKHEHGPVLQVGALLHDLCVEDQVGGSWEGRHRIQTRPETPHPFLSRFLLIPELAPASIPARASLSRTSSWCPPSRSPSLWIAAPNSSPPSLRVLLDASADPSACTQNIDSCSTWVMGARGFVILSSLLLSGLRFSIIKSITKTMKLCYAEREHS